MVKTILTIDVMSIKDSSIISFIVPLCLGYSPWVLTKIIKLLRFCICFHNVVVQTLDFDSRSLSLNLNRTLNILLSCTLIMIPCHPTLVKRLLPNYRIQELEFEYQQNLHQICFVHRNLVIYPCHPTLLKRDRIKFLQPK